MEYEQLRFTDKNEIEAMLASKDPKRILQALIGMQYGVADRLWVQDRLLEFINHPDYAVAHNAIVGLEELVRFTANLDTHKIVQRLKSVTAKEHLDTVKDAIKGVKEHTKRRM